jgi:hypothetical protein
LAEFDELDGVLRDALQRAAQPGDSTGVADAIRSRVAAGDLGTSVAGGMAPGWGGGVFGWLPWLALVVLAGIGGGVVGASGVVGAEQQQIVAGYTAVLDDSAPAASCPGGPVIGSLSAGDRVLAVARSEESDYLGVRDPNDFARTLWFDRAVVVVDAGQADVATLPVEACPVATVEVIEPTPVPTEEPTEDPQPPAPKDSTPPNILQQGANPTTVYGDEGVCGATTPLTTTVAAYVVSDNVGVTSVTATWVAAGGGSATLAPNGSGWSFVYDPPSNFTGTVAISLVARDSAGNSSTAKTVNVQVWDSCFG